MPKFKVKVVEEYTKIVSANNADEARSLIEDGLEVYDEEDLDLYDVQVEEVSDDET